MREPNFFLAGTTKGGTSTLYLWLSQHPDIFLPPRKELHYFCSCPERLKVAHTWDEYLEFFGSGDERIVGEASPCYLYYPAIAGAISQKVPKAKILASLRDPVERFWSHFLMNRTYREDYPAPAEILNEWEKQPPIDATDDLVGMGMYHDQIAHFYHSFGESNIKVVFLEDMSAHPQQVLADILAFLGIAAHPVDTDERDKMYVEGRNAVAHFLLRNRRVRRLGAGLLGPRARRTVKYSILGQSDSRPQVPDDIAGRLREIYRYDSLALESLLSGPLPWAWHR